MVGSEENGRIGGELCDNAGCVEIAYPKEREDKRLRPWRVEIREEEREIKLRRELNDNLTTHRCKSLYKEASEQKFGRCRITVV